MIRAIRSLWRLLTIARVLARYDALFLLRKVRPARPVLGLVKIVSRKDPTRRPGQRLALALQALGPTFIKFGQALSTRPDLVGEDVARDLAELRDRLPPFPFDEVRRIIERELDEALTDTFATFEETPVAAASMAQVHFATTIEGQDVAVKVLRPGIEAAFERDLDLLLWLAETAAWVQPATRRFQPVESVETFERAVHMEMDLRFEAAACAEMSDNFADDDTVHIPEVDWMRTGQRVFTMERISGIPAHDRDSIMEAGLDPKQVTERAATAFFRMVFRDGFFHGDMHPGNIFVRADGNLALVDFGIMGRVDRQTRRYLGEMLVGFLTEDYRRVAEIHIQAGYVPADQSVDAFTQATRSIAAPIMGRPLNDISLAKLLAQLFQVAETFGMVAQPHLLLLQKTMLTAEGVGRALAPDVNMWELAMPLAQEWMRETLGPGAIARTSLSEAGRTLERLPRLLAKAEQASTLFTAAGVRLHPDTVADMRRRRPASPFMLVPWILVIVLLILLVKS